MVIVIGILVMDIGNLHLGRGWHGTPIFHKVLAFLGKCSKLFSNFYWAEMKNVLNPHTPFHKLICEHFVAFQLTSKALINIRRYFLKLFLSVSCLLSLSCLYISEILTKIIFQKYLFAWQRYIFWKHYFR